MSGLLEGFPILYKGGTLTMIPNEYRKDINKIVEFWKMEQVTVGFVPSHYAEQIINSEYGLPKLRVLLTGGEPVHNLQKIAVIQFYIAQGI